MLGDSGDKMADELTLSVLGSMLLVLVGILVWVFRLQGNLRDTQKEITEKLSSIGLLSGVATGLQSSMSNLQAEVGNIRQQAERIATLGEKYQTTEELTKRIHSMLIGSYSKGRTGEQVLRQMMGELSRMGLIESNVSFGTRTVEYAVKFDDGKMLAIDSKIVGTNELERLHDEGASEEERNQIADALVGKIRGKIDEVAGYIEQGRTLPFAVMAIPDSVLEYGSSLMGEASKRNVIVLGYSSVPPLIEYFFKVHSAYAVQQEVGLIFDSLAAVNTSLSKFTDHYFANRFSKPLKTMSGAVDELQSGVRNALQSADARALLKNSPRGELPLEGEHRDGEENPAG